LSDGEFVTCSGIQCQSKHSEPILRAIGSGAAEDEIRSVIRREGRESLVVDGTTGLDEVRGMTWCDFADA
jgi:hypothetical protein